MSGPLAGRRVIDAATVLAAPFAAQILGDFGAEVIKIEHPTKPDSFRAHGASKAGQGLWAKMLGRNKRTMTLDFHVPEAVEVFRRLIATADVLIENFRPGTLERWGLGPDVLSEMNPKLVVVRVTGFGQTGPYARRPAFGTLAEAMSGFAALTGEPDGPPTLPPFGLADSIAGISAALAAVMGLYHRDTSSGVGQVADVSILEPIIAALGNQAIVWDQLGEKQPRMGNRSLNNAPRNTYQCADGTWVAISASSDSIAERVMRLVGRPDLIDEPWFASSAGRGEHGDLLDEPVREWIAQRSKESVIDGFEQAEAAIAVIYDIEDLVTDPHVVDREIFTTVEDPDLGALVMTNVLFQMSETPGSIRFSGRGYDEDSAEILEELGFDAAACEQLRAAGVIR